MSHLALRRVMVRMLHDPALVEAVYADPARALAGVPLSAVERAWLVATPRAAWGTDPERPQRVLAALLDEFPVTSSAAAARAGSFFASAAFHRSVQERGSLALAFGEHLATEGAPATIALARVETAIAEVRRAPRTPVPSPVGMLRRSPAAAVIAVPAGTLQCYDALRRGAPAPPLAAGDERLLILRSGADTEVTVEEIPVALATLLADATLPRERAALLAATRRLGTDPGEDAEVVDELIRDGLLL